jgi:hypothetical protein
MQDVPEDEDAGRSRRGTGLLGFAAILLVTFGAFNIFDGIAAIARSHVFTDDARYVVGDLRAWGWVVLLLGALELAAAAAIAAGRSWARWFGIVVLALNALGQMMFLPAYPFWSLVVIAVDVVALYALSVYGGQALPDRIATGSTWTGPPGPTMRPPA